MGELMGLRERVRRDVLALPAPVDLRERRSRLAFLDALGRLPRPFGRLGGPIHVTGSAIVTGPRGIVLHRHKRMGIWLQPGGHLEPGETPWDAARREAAEETGLPLRHAPGGPVLLHVDVHDAPLGHVHLDLRYLLLAPDRDPCPGPGESPDARWFSLAEARATADAGLAGALQVAHLVRKLLRRGPFLPPCCGGGGAPAPAGGTAQMAGANVRERAANRTSHEMCGFGGREIAHLMRCAV